MNRTHHNNELNAKNEGQLVQLRGWVAKKRNLGSLVFIDLRDREGITQIVCEENLHEITDTIRHEYVIWVEGVVQCRRDANPKLKTGEIEVLAKSITIINTAETTPLIIAEETDALEDTRMKYRYLDLRRPNMQQHLFMRHHITKTIRNYLDDLGFIDVETPYLAKSTPEGARDYLVPSRVHPGEFYALPQSPQMFKQLLMIAGFEKYYQVARCFRDEDLRADRQPEFTQVDIEMSFITQEDIQEMLEGMMKKIMKDVKGIDIETPFLRLPYDVAMSKYGSDKPDIRFDLELVSLDAFAKDCGFGVFEQAVSNGGIVSGINVKQQANHFSRKAIDQLQEVVKTYKAKGLAFAKVTETGLEGPIAKFFDDAKTQALMTMMEASVGDLLVFVADKASIVYDALGALRLHLGKTLNLIDENVYRFLWVVDFPLLEYDEEANRYFAKHHPFTSPKGGKEAFNQPLDEILANAYDIVLNGYEVGGGSIRIYQQEVQEAMFRLLGFNDESIKEQFGFFVDAFQYGTPPHGGIALGLDRLAMILSHASSIRDVIAFPKNASATCPMTSAPSHVSEAQLKELKLLIQDK